jgi:hypothetical protein
MFSTVVHPSLTAIYPFPSLESRDVDMVAFYAQEENKPIVYMMGYEEPNV